MPRTTSEKKKQRRPCNNDWAASTIVCQLHNNVWIGKRTNDLVEADIAGAWRGMLSLTQVGQMRAFRSELKFLLREVHARTVKT